MKWRLALGWLAVIAVAATSAAAQEVHFAATAVADDNGTTTIILGPGGGTAFTVTGSVQAGDNAAGAAKVTYMGVLTSPPPEVLVDQLKLPKGAGLLVDFVDTKSPAAAAGIRKNDVLVKLDDQLLTSSQHLATLVQMHKPKDKVALALIREAQEQKLTVELGESDAAQEQAVNRRLQQNLPPNVAQMFANMNGARRAAASSTSSFSDGEHSLTVTTNGREKTLVAKDRDGKVLFDGPVNTDEQRKAVPPEILAKYRTMEQSMRMEVRGGDGIARAVAIMNGGGGIAFGNAAGGGLMLGGRSFGQPTGRSYTWSDNEHNLAVTTRERGKFLSVDDKNGQVLWQGFIQTDEQRKAVPPEYLPKLEKLEAKTREESRGTVSLIEDGMTVTLTTEAGKQTVVAKNAESNVLFEGPVDTEDQRAKMPEKVRTKLEKLWKSCAAVMQTSQD
ncbi:MAG: PDZ domain-containing protein [Planctomycetota bacterium]|nr:PDZ domain-containing protein [Planctomycetota bacterium]